MSATMSSKIAAWLSSKSKSLFKKSSRKSKSWLQRMASKLPYRQKQNSKNEWKKAESHDVVGEKSHEEDQNSKDSCAHNRSTLMTACHSGHTEKVKSLLEEGVDINEQDKEGTTALILACLGRHTEIIEMLLEKGAQADVQKADGKTALMCSSQVEVVKLLLEHGAQVSLQDKAKWTALMRAADNGLTEVVQLLLEHHAQVDAQSEWRQTALMLASRKGHAEVTQLLVEHNAEVDLQDFQGWTALMLASRNGHNEVAKLLLQQGAKVDLCTGAGTALMWASEEGHEEVAKLLLEHGAQVNLCSDIGETPLMWACDAGHSGVVNLLLDYGAQVDLRTKWLEETALLRASKKGHSEVVKLLLELCAQADLQTEKGKTALMCASEEGHYEVARLLLEHGAQVDMQNSEGETALMLASSKGRIEVIKLLMQHGAQVYMKDNYGFSILMRACRQGQADIVNLLLAQGCDVQINEPDSRGETALMYASVKGSLEVVRCLLNLNAQADLQNVDGRTALMQASSRGHSEVAKLLLEHGAEIALQDKYGWSVLMHACNQSQTDLIQLLIEQGCGVQIHQPDKFGKTALMCATEKGLYEVAEVLLAHGAQVDLQDNKGKTALMLACKKEHYEVANLLLEHHAHVNLQANKGKTALMFAAKKGCYEVAKLLLENNAEVDLQATQGNNETGTDGITALWMSMKHEEVATMLIEHGAQVNMHSILHLPYEECMEISEYDSFQTEVKVEGLTFLMGLMFVWPSEDFIKFLLKHGVDVDFRANLTFTFISEQNFKKSESELLECGAKVDQRTTMEIDGLTALMCAALSSKDKDNIAEILLEHGAQIDSQTKGDVDGLTALMVAAIFDSEEVADVLLKHGAQVDLQAKGNINIAFFSSSVYDAVKVLLPEKGSLADFQIKHEFEGVTALMCAILFGNYDIALSLLKHGAQVNIQAKGVMKGKTALILALVADRYRGVKLLLEHGANADLQDDGGWSPLMYALQAENLEAFELLIAHGANIHLKTNEGKTVHDICPPDLKKDPRYIDTLLMSINKCLSVQNSNFPGLMFFYPPSRETLTSREATIGQLCDGVSVYVPTNALSSEDESAELCICPCFSGPFEFPAVYKPVSPAYLILHNKTRFQKDITIRMHHYANLQSEEDCEDMAFLTASSTPEYRGSQPVYVFKEIPGARGVFKPGDQVGEISLQHFCLLITGKRKRAKDSEDSSESLESSSKRHQGDLYYSARLYRSAENDRAVFTAVFCMCLYHPIYIQHCDTVIARDYTGGKSTDFVQVCEDSIVINSNDPSGKCVIFDKVPAQILRREVHLPEILNIDVGELLEYPPRLSISVKTSQDVTSPIVLKVDGLDKECGFNLLPISISSSPPSATLQMTLNNPTPAPAIQGSQPPVNQSAEKLYAPSTTSQSFQQKGDIMLNADNSTLDIDDLSDVLDEVKTLSSKWRLLLTKLGVKQSTLDTVKTDNIGDAKMCLYEALGEWLRLNYDHERHGRPSWMRLVKAVSDIDFALSETLTKKHSSAT